MENYELYHHGIKGMHWGIRRTKEQLGYRTSSAKYKVRSINKDANEKIKQIKAQGRTKSRVEKAEERAAAKIAKAEAKYLPKKKNDEAEKQKKISEMSDEEIVSKINRIRLEKALKSEMDSVSPKQVSKGKAFVDSMMKNVIAPAAKDAGKDLMTRFLKDKGADLLGLNKKETEDSLAALRKEVDVLELLKKKKEAYKYFQREKEAEAKRNKNKSGSKP